MKKVTAIEPKRHLLVPQKRVAAYARVSEDSDPMMRSVEAQISYYSKLIQSNPDWIYAGVYADKGISGTGIKHRRSFLEMMRACEEGRIDIILCKSISRFARNTVDLLNAIRRLKELSVEVQFEREHISSLSKEGEFMLTILASFAQEESRSISENVKWGMRKRFAKGEGMNTPDHVYGYRYDREQKRYMIIPQEAETVREIYRLYLEGASTGDILKWLNEEGKRSTYGCRFDYTRIHFILTNEIYTGNRLLQKTYIESHLTKKLIKNRGELPKYLCEDLHEAIIDQETFDRVQEEHKRRGEYYAKHYMGYRFENGGYVLEPEEGETVRWIFKRYLERVPLYQIAVELDEKGIKTYRQTEFKDYKVRNIVMCDFYDPDNPAVDEPLFDRETYEKVQAEHEFREKHKARNIQGSTVPVSNRRIFGYQYDEEQKRYIVIPDEAETIREIFTHYLSGTPASAIADKLNAEGKRSTLGRMFDNGRINELLDYEIYTGDLLVQKTFIDSDSKQRKNHGELPMYRLTDAHEAIIDRETFQRVQEMRKSRAEFQRNYIFGYLLVDGKYVIHPQNAEIVRLIFKLYLEHEGDTAIAAKLNEQGYKTARGRCFDAKTVHRITVKKNYAPDTPNVAEPIFDAETYDKIKAERKIRAAHPKKTFLRNHYVGYQIIGGAYYIEPQSVGAVRLAVAMYLEHKTYTEIARALNDRGYKTLTGQDFIHVTVKAIVQSDCYYPGFPNVAEPIFDAEMHEKVKTEHALRDKYKNSMGVRRIVGYKVIDGMYCIDPQSVGAVRLAIEMFLQSKKKDEIAKALNEQGYRTISGITFTESSVKEILANERYYPGCPDVAEPVFDEETHEKVKAEREYRYMHGFQIPPQRFVGYTIIDGKYCIAPQTVGAARLAIKLFLESRTRAEIAIALNEQGYTTVTGVAFTKSSVRDIVMNDHYYPGFPDVAEPIFDAETYEKVKAEREFRAAHRCGKGLQQLLWYKMIGGKYYIDPQGVAAVRLAIEMYLDYRTHSEIIDALNERGYKTLTSRDFTEVTVRAIIKNDRYYPGYSDVAEPIFDEKTHEKSQDGETLQI